MYIGQSVRPVEQRFRRHVTDAKACVLDTHFARAIRKYGEEHFGVEIIDTACTQEELNKKEQYWIREFDSVANGYNETDAVYKCGGNTYMSKTPEEMTVIRENLRASKIGSNNPNSRSVKCFNVNSGEEITFDTFRYCQEYFKEKTHRFISTRVNNQTKSLYRGEWKIAYADEEYQEYRVYHKPGKRVLFQNQETGESKEYCSMRLCARECGLPERKIDNLHKKGKGSFELNGCIFTVLE